ncbi:LOW QUALITY PROTEIN: leukocyte cell-derived chemotaxin 1 [Bombina bombina]|uniref:LOW QUALITY PROTEIN: leukocyte cell-derived chemotaxin 1 n=1 Tax=Bombina bombina TaxID=8345 RepID=UPI00235A5ABC|nr:LOW QUALITY PROTEIN: leukocyte cell-derived chemotaxin 1 [Bombina bombina]
MAEISEKVPIALAGPDDVEHCLPPAYTAVTVKPSSSGRLLRIGAVVLISGALLLLFGAIGAFYFWKANDKHVYNVHYTMSINGKVQEGSMEIDSVNNLETFKTGAGNEEAVEVHDFQIGITGIRFAGGEKCYIKAQAKAHIPDVDSTTKESLSFEMEDEIMPAKFDENSLIWVAADQPVKDNSFLSSKILELCIDLPIFWLRPTYPKENQRGKREIGRKARQAQNLNLDQFEAAAEEVNTRRQGNRRTKPANQTQTPAEPEREAPFNPENPYHLKEKGGMTFDPMHDHQGICCIEFRRSYTHCQRICEPPPRLLSLGPYNYQGCRSACRIVMPCSWWVARILGVV